MKYLVMLLSGLIVTEVKSQNLVPNPGFEDYKQLPCNLNEFTVQELLEHWYQPLPTSTDYWNGLAENECFLNPAHANATARTGQGMIGIIIADTYRGVRHEYKEYVEVKLLETLTKGSFYNVQLYAKGRTSELAHGDILESNNLGAAFSDSLIFYPVSDNSPNHLLLNSAVNEKSIIKDNWSRIGGCFLADSKYQYLLIGNFNSINSTELVQLTYNNPVATAYYFIDDVKVEKLPYNVSPLANEVTFCPDQSFVELDAFLDGAIGYQWEDGSTEATLRVSERLSKVYSVNILFKECSYKQKFHVTYIPAIKLGSDTILCEGEVLTIKPNHPLKEYVWSDGSSDSIKHVSASGVYSVTVPSGCSIRDSVEVEFIDCPGFSPNIITPNGDLHNQFLIFKNIGSRSWSLEVFNRWGKMVYFSERYENDWSADELADGVYFYRLHSDEVGRIIRGFVQVTRSRNAE